MKNTITYTPVLHKGEKRILILFKYDTALTLKLRKTTDAKWSQTMRGWHIADTIAYRTKCNLPLEDIATIKDNKNDGKKITTKTACKITDKEKTAACNSTLPVVNVKPINTKATETRMGICFAKNKVLENKIKQLTAVKWCETNDCWHLPCTQKSYDDLCNALKDTATVNNKVLLAYLKKRKAGLQVNKLAGSKKNKDPQLVFKISAHNMLLLQRTVEQLQLKSYSASTLRTYKNEVGIFLQTIKNKKADLLTTEDVRRYIHYCIDKLLLSENTIHSRLNALKFLYEQVLGHEKFFVEIPRPKKHLQLPKVLGEQELRRLFAAPRNLKHKAILFIAYSAGLRVSEVINLRLQDIDRERQQLFIYCSKGKKDRYVRLSPLVLDVLEQYYKLSDIKPKNYLFEGNEEGQPYSIRSAQQIFNDARKSAGILKSLSFHNLRHSFATHLLEKGVDVVFIKEILGHFDIRTTERYLHVRRDTLINIESPIDDLYRTKTSL
ncbi:MAG: site-specific integrase [Ferruginibacter sp.]|nr:site-specific integrase [Ferruginibacter sp.]